jgi:hypothetical protein
VDYLEVAARSLLSISEPVNTRGFYLFERPESAKPVSENEPDDETASVGFLISNELQKYRVRDFSYNKFRSSARFAHKSGVCFFRFRNVKRRTISLGTNVKVENGRKWIRI